MVFLISVFPCQCAWYGLLQQVHTKLQGLPAEYLVILSDTGTCRVAPPICFHLVRKPAIERSAPSLLERSLSLSVRRSWTSFVKGCMPKHK